MNKKFFNKLALLCLLMLLILTTSCKKVEEDIVVDNKQEPITEVEIPKDPDDIMKEFYGMINGSETAANVELFVKESIENLDKDQADSMIWDYESYLIQDLNVLLKDYEIANSNPELSQTFDLGVKDNVSSVKDVQLKELLDKTINNGYIILKGGGYIYPEIDYNKIVQYKEYITSEVVDYLEIMEIETKNRFTYGEEIEIPLVDLLSRAMKAENYLVGNKESKASNKIYELYTQYIDGIILGSGNPYVLANEGTSIIKDEILDEYKTFIFNNKDSRTSEILNEYINILENNDNDMDAAEVIVFFDNRYSSIKEKFMDLGL